MINVVLLGAGNLAKRLFEVIESTEKYSIVQWYNRTITVLDSYKDRVSTTDDLRQIISADIYLIAISDDAITDFSNQLPFENKFVVHVSGGISIEALSSKNRRGVMYPLQTFSKNLEIHFEEVPVCLETDKAEDLQLLKGLASSISSSVYEIDSKQRKKLHLAAVFVNNFTNHLYKIGFDICENDGIPFTILHPLIEETFNKIKHTNPLNAQTGPAKRKDKKTMKEHLDELENFPSEYKEIYKTITASIQKTYGGKEL